MCFSSTDTIMIAYSKHIVCVIAVLVGGGALFAGCTKAPAQQAASPASTSPHVRAASLVDAGRYLVIVGGCNDCHTPGYAETGGNVPEAAWLTGSPVGFRGPWGTSYPANLRLTVRDMTEDAWVTMLHTRTALPPMPWMNLNRLNEQDARALYQFIRSLGPTGERMPTAVGPDQEPTTPYFVFEPQHLDRLQPPAQASSLEE